LSPDVNDEEFSPGINYYFPVMVFKIKSATDGQNGIDERPEFPLLPLSKLSEYCGIN